MSKTLQINIAEPCHENWQQMTPSEQGRFCGSCQKMVVDFTAMTDKEILDYISKSSHNICGRANTDQMNRNIKVAEHKKRFSWAYVWNLLVAGFMITKADAQVGKIAVKKPRVEQVVQQPIMGVMALRISKSITGTVVNANDGTPIQGASIFIKDNGVATDSTGQFELPIKPDKPVELVISSIGFETQTLVVAKAECTRPFTIKLKPAASALQEVVVTGYGSKDIHAYAGGIGVVRTTTIIDKFKTALRPSKEVKAFPNPVARGNSININLALKQPGEYRMELLDASGKIVHAQLVQMVSTTQTIKVPTNHLWSAGVYMLRVSGQHIKNVYQNKVIIQ